MDESLSDFQEKKTSCTGPKNVSKSKVNPIKKRKHIKGQRDIRTLVRCKKNELVTYTKDFDHMCKSSGIDIDSEQLQLAIALSKSLHDSETLVDVETVIVEPLSALERTKKIKSTLQEYGFKVPSTCVLKKPSKRAVSNKKYKLLTTPDTEKNQIICNKYSEVLKRNLTLNTHSVLDNTDKKIYNIATNIPYCKIKNVEEFYLKNFLIEKSTHKTSLLKDWSAIPGRPISPDLKASNFKFDELEFTQDELDCILSSPIQVAQEIINRKSMMDCDKESTQERFNEDMNTQNDRKLYVYDSKNKELCSTFDQSISKNMGATQRSRSASPDLFEDDEYSIGESTQSQNSEIKSSTNNLDKMSFMDLTECVSNISYKQQNIEQSEENIIVSEITKTTFLGSKNLQHEKDQLTTHKADSGGDAHYKKDKFRQCTYTNSTLFTDNESQSKLSSETIIDVNDFMEVTECVVSEFHHENLQNFELSFKYSKCPQNICMSKERINTNEDKNLSGNSKIVQSKRCTTSSSKGNLKDNSHDVIENIDLTQSVDCLKEANILTKGYIDDIKSLDSNQKMEPVCMDLTQSSNSNEDLPMIQLSGTKTNRSSDDTIIIYDDNTGYNVLAEDAMLDTDTSKEIIQCETDKTLNDKISISEDCLSGSKTPSYKDNIDVFSDNENAKSNTSLIDNDDTIDITHSPKLSTHTYYSSESLGKQNNVSIDYDELYDKFSPTTDSVSKKNYTLEYEPLVKISDEKNSSCESAKSLQKEVFNSPGLDKKENFETIKNYDITIEDVSNEENINTVSLNDSKLPNVAVKSICKNTKVLRKICESQSIPHTLLDLNKSVNQTPVNNEYIIKTDNVTPILDYESMTTPARNKELEKYGLKPFKRKRAIKLLTYLYNQTHPLVEQCVLDEMPSTSKKPKVNEQGTNKCTFADKHHETTFEEQDLNKENVYKETKEHPDIKEIDCCPEDWVFQTREKAKVHSCRVPLHIAFHNYVSCRSRLRAAILRYEPINIDVIHKDLIANGFRYNPKELLKFMDKKCITVKTAESGARHQKI